MTPLMLAVVAVILTALYLVQWKKKNSRIVELIEKLPGPRAFPIVGTTWEIFIIPRNKRMARQVEIFKQYKPIVRVWNGSLPAVVISQPHHVEAILRDTKHLHKGQMYRFMLPWLGTGLLTSTGSKWHSHRKMITPTFHFTILDNFVEVFAEKTEVLIQKLKKEVGNPGFDIYPYITKCALDIICETAMGTSVNAQDETESSYVKAVYDMSELITKRFVTPWLYPNFIFRLTRDGKRHEEALQELHNFTKKVIRERKELYKTLRKEGATVDDIGKKRRLAFLDLLIESSEGGAKLTDEEIREEVDTFMFEGHDTTSAGIGWVLFMLGQYPDVQDKVYEEVEGIFGDSDRPATMRDLQEMKYLERVIKETLRLYPSVPLISRYLQEDLDLGDYIIPAESSVGISIFVLHRDPKQFPDPEKFNPDNFLPENVTKRHPYAFVPFSAGPRNCIGQKFALLEEKTVISTIVRHYKIRALERREDIKLIGELILRPESGIRVALSPRR